MQTLTIAALAIFIYSPLGQAKEVRNIPQIGNHQSIFIVEKNKSPENIAVVYTKVDEKCRFEMDPENDNHAVFDFYWLMNRQNYKPMASFFKNTFRERILFQESAADRANHFDIIATDLKELDTDLEEPRMQVVSKVIPGGCDVEAFMNLGPSDNNVRIRLDGIYGEGNMWGTIYSVTLKGEIVGKDGRLTGKKIARKYLGK